MLSEDWWLAANDTAISNALLRLGPRRMRLFVAACCRLVTDLAPDSPVGTALDAIETFADTGKTKAALRRARQSLRAFRYTLPVAVPSSHPAFAVLWAVEAAASENAAVSAAFYARLVLCRPGAGTPADATRRLARLYTEIDGPYHIAESNRRTPTAVALARQMYDTRDFAAMPILADALQDAGCEDAAILSHCRGPGPHVRGCWVVDRVLGLG